MDGLRRCSKLVGRLVHSILPVFHVPASLCDNLVYEMVGQEILLVAGLDIWFWRDGGHIQQVFLSSNFFHSSSFSLLSLSFLSQVSSQTVILLMQF